MTIDQEMMKMKPAAVDVEDDARGSRRRCSTKNKMTRQVLVAIAGTAILSIAALTTSSNSNISWLTNNNLRNNNDPDEFTTQNRRQLAAFTLADFADPKSSIAKSPFITSAKKCDPSSTVPVNSIHGGDWMAQDGEDKKLMKWFGNLCEGSYIEMGALDGKKYSNSYVFNKARHWKGVMIELMTHNYNQLIQNRPNEIATIHAGVCDSPAKLHYFVPSDRRPNPVGGIYEFTSESFRQQWWKDISLDDPRVQEIQCDTLDSLLLQYAPQNTFFDFYSLDVEGAELAVLNSIDFDRVGFGVVLVEADEHNQFKNLAMRELLESKGYLFLEEYQRSYWFVNRNFHEIYHDLIY